jgi:hypothetical protein
MATVAQIQANRLNAQQSTGPRTAEGKERASQNALKHGLLAREAVIVGEDPAEFEMYREGMLQTLDPVGMVETMLAERVVGLSWRLRRAERLQNAAFATLDEGEPAELLEARLEEWKQHRGSERDRDVCGVLDENAALAKAVVADFAEARVLDRMLMYERRIESSLYRAMAELRRERQARTAANASKEASHLAADQERATSAELASVWRTLNAGGRPGYADGFHWSLSGWQRQAESSELVDGFLAGARPSANKFAAATRSRRKTVFDIPRLCADGVRNEPNFGRKAGMKRDSHPVSWTRTGDCPRSGPTVKLRSRQRDAEADAVHRDMLPAYQRHRLFADSTIDAESGVAVAAAVLVGVASQSGRDVFGDPVGEGESTSRAAGARADEVQYYLVGGKWRVKVLPLPGRLSTVTYPP